jgi:hypothetical protein
MRRPVTDDTKTQKTRRARPGRRGVSAAELEQALFRELAYRLVHCTEPEEQTRLKEQVVRSVLTRARKHENA